MTQFWPLTILAICGGLISAQATINVAMGRSLGVWFFAFIFTVVQLAATYVGYLLFGRPGRWDLILTTPPWQYIGGVIGLFTLVGMAHTMGRTGTLSGLIALVAGQLIVGMFIDHFGLLQAPQQSITLLRVGGVGLVLAGLALTRV